jgi:hypothetical protein
MRKCPFTNCSRKLAFSHFACREHFLAMGSQARQVMSALLGQLLNRNIRPSQYRREVKKVVADVEDCPFDPD